MEPESNHTIAPFVMKTYQMVNDPRIDSLITWGSANNSFLVVEPLEFSDKILPAFFKHNNFSSFIRQLNTYGFRKVDPDNWEFANEWFLRGQTHLLKNIVRRKNGRNLLHCKHGGGDEGDEEEEEMFSEIMRMKKEQKDLEEELERMNRRLEATERRPEQMMEFLCKVVEEPEILPRMMLVGRERAARRISLGAAAGEKKMKLAAAAASCPCPVKNEEEEDGGGVALGVNSSFHLHDADFDVDTLCQSSPENPLTAGWLSRSNNNCSAVSTTSTSSSSLSSSESGGFTVATPLDVFSGYGSMGSGTSAATAPHYPFSLLEGSI